MSLDTAFDMDTFKHKNGIPHQADFRGFFLAIGRRMKFLKTLPALISPVILAKDAAEALCFSSIYEVIDAAGQVGHNSAVAAVFDIDGRSMTIPFIECCLVPFDFVHSFFEVGSLQHWEAVQLICFKFGVGWGDSYCSPDAGAFRLRNELYKEDLIKYLYCIDGKLELIECEEDGPRAFGYNKLKIDELEDFLRVNDLPALSEPL